MFLPSVLIALMSVQMLFLSNELMKNAEPAMNISMAEDTSGPEKSLKVEI